MTNIKHTVMLFVALITTLFLIPNADASSVLAGTEGGTSITSVEKEVSMPLFKEVKINYKTYEPLLDYIEEKTEIEDPSKNDDYAMKVLVGALTYYYDNLDSQFVAKSIAPSNGQRIERLAKRIEASNYNEERKEVSLTILQRIQDVIRNRRLFLLRVVLIVGGFVSLFIYDNRCQNRGISTDK